MMLFHIRSFSEYRFRVQYMISFICIRSFMARYALFHPLLSSRDDIFLMIFIIRLANSFFVFCLFVWSSMSLSYIRRIVVSVLVHILCRNISISQWVVYKISFSYICFSVCIFSCVCVDEI